MTEVLVAGVPATLLETLREELPDVALSFESSGEGTLAKLGDRGWAAVVLGCTLSDMAGIAVLQELSTRAGPRIPIVFQANGGGRAAREEALRLGARRVVQGEADAHSLAGVLRGVLEEDLRRPCIAVDVTAAIGSLWERFKNIAFERLDSVEAAVVAQLEGRLDAEARRRAERDAHKLAGSVGTFGFTEASRVARDIELLLQRSPTPEDTLRLSDLAIALRRALERPPATGPAVKERRSSQAAGQPAATRTEAVERRRKPANGRAGVTGGAASPPPTEQAGAPTPRSASPSTAIPVAEPAPQPVRAAGAAAGSRDTRPLLLVLDADIEPLDEDGETGRLRVLCAADPEAAYIALGAEKPDVVAVDLRFGGTADRGLALLAEVNRRAPLARTIVLTSGATPTERLEVARRGGSMVVQKPVTLRKLVDLAARMAGRPQGGPGRVLVVDADEAVLARASAHLRAPELEVVTLPDPQHFWETLERTRPDVLLLAEEMPGISGSELLGVIRGDPRWAGLPVLFLTDGRDGAVDHAFAAGADDIVDKPFAGPELRVRVESRLERLRLRRSIAEVDALTGLLNRQRALTAIGALLQAAERSRSPLTIVLLDIDGLGEIDAMFGDAAGDAVLQRLAATLREDLDVSDVLGRWQGGTFVLALPGASVEDAIQRVRQARDRLRDGPASDQDGRAVAATFGAGVASYPADGRDAATLLHAAEQALRAAKAEGPAMILPARWPDTSAPRHTESVDVVLVEDDVALAGLLSHTLLTRGYTTRCIADGEEAIEALAGGTPRLHGRVVILDVDLPGRDGFEVLRTLARDGVTERSRVVMLTVRATEPEVVRALELGAFDHIGKPFSVQILMQRLRRALGD